MKNINTLVRAGRISKLSNVDDVPAAVPGKFLVRHADGSGYSWGLPTTQVKQSTIQFNEIAKQKVQATLVMDSPIVATDFWRIVADGKMYGAGPASGTLNDTFTGTNGTWVNTTLWVATSYSAYANWWNQYAYFFHDIQGNKLRHYIGHDYGRTGGMITTTRATMFGGFECTLAISSLDVSCNESYPFMLVGNALDTRGGNLTIAFQTGSTRSFRLCYNIDYLSSFNQLPGRQVPSSAIISMGVNTAVSFKFTYNGTLLGMYYSYDGWQTQMTYIENVNMSSFFECSYGIQLGMGIHFSNNSGSTGCYSLFDSFTYIPINGGYFQNASLPLKTLTQITDELRTNVGLDYDVVSTGSTSFTFAKRTTGSFTYSYLAGTSDSIVFALLQAGYAPSPTDRWVLIINGIAHQIFGSSVTTIEDVVNYFTSELNVLDGIVADKLSTISLHMYSEIPGLDYAIEGFSEPSNMIAITSSSNALQQAFKDLVDAPTTYTGNAGKVVTVKLTQDGVDFTDFKFKSLRDTPSVYVADKFLKINSDGTAVVLTDPPASSFLALTDSPDSYTGVAGKSLIVNAGSTGLEFGDAGTTITAGATAPSNPVVGQLWINTNYTFNARTRGVYNDISYTPTLLSQGTVTSSRPISGLYDGNTGDGYMLTGVASTVKIKITFAVSTNINKLKVYIGQFNGNYNGWHGLEIWNAAETVKHFDVTGLVYGENVLLTDNNLISNYLPDPVLELVLVCKSLEGTNFSFAELDIFGVVA